MRGYAAEMAATPKPLGVVGGRVAGNLRHLRRGTSTYELAKRLDEIGWPIRPSAITLIEAGRRRTDVDDVTALAIALGCSPNKLMMPSMNTGVSHGVPVTGDVYAMDVDQWRWACGAKPLVRMELGEDGFEPGPEPSRSETVQFVWANQPHLFIDADADDRDVVTAIAETLAQVVKDGTPMERIRGILNDALDQVAAVSGAH
jgi:hypothetical protein